MVSGLEIVPLYPLDRSELLGPKHPQFIATAFRGAVPDMAEALSKEEISDLVTAGGYARALIEQALAENPPVRPERLESEDAYNRHVDKIKTAEV